MGEPDVILQMKDICKSFDANQALDHVNFELYGREIHGLLGGNGAGKTTLMNTLYGLYRADSGEVYLKGKRVSILSPKDAIQHGIGMVHQHFLQINNFPVIQNIVLGTAVKKKFSMDLSYEANKVQELCRRFTIDVNPYATISQISMGTRQKVEILKALYRGVDILILDEPTTNLTPQEVDALFVTLKVMVREGLSIVFITHKLREVLSVCDRISLLRDGKNVSTLDRKTASEEDLVRGMVGDVMDIKESVIFSKADIPNRKIVLDAKPILEVEQVNVVSEQGLPLLKDISFEICESEIFGIAGVTGNGQRELAECLVGIQPLTSGKVIVDGQKHRMETTELLSHGITYIPEDRMEDGYLPKANVAQNLILGSQRQEPYSKNGFINWKTVYEASKDLIGEYNIKTSGPTDTAANLSGGNIQRMMIARAFAHAGSRLLIAHNPTRGLDIPSMDFVYKKLLERKAQGGAILLLSEDLDELLLVCDRIGVLYRGELAGILDRKQFEKYELGRMMSGVKRIN